MVLLALALAAVSLAALVAIPHVASGYVPRAPILIVGDAEFTPGNGVTGGSGTPNDPYVIEGWEIDASAADGIAILNTTAHFIVRNVRVHSGFWNHVGVWLEGVQNGRVEGSAFADNADGVYVLDSADVTLTANTITGSLWDGIRVDLSTRISLVGNDAQWNQFDGVSAYETTALAVTNNVLSNNDWGVYLWNVDSATVAGNNASGNNMVGIGFDLSANATATGNQLWDNDWGFDVSDTSHLVVRGNTVGRSTSDAVAVTGGTNLTFLENTFAGTGGGLIVVGATNARAYHNTFLGNTIQAADDPGANAWDNGYPDGGNFWSDYAGVDNCSGPNQNVCPDPDGIGDTPYVIDADSRDRYPLMKPGYWIQDARPGPRARTDAPAMLSEPGTPVITGPRAPGRATRERSAEPSTLDSAGPSATSGEPVALQEHAPIFIWRNGDFTSANGVVSGGGTPANPYVIEGWSINASQGAASAGIVIGLTDAYFVIRNVSVHDGLWTAKDGIQLSWVANGRIENASVTNNINGINLNGPPGNVVVAFSTVYSNWWRGIRAMQMTGLTVEGNSIYGHRLFGIQIVQSDHVLIRGNNASPNGMPGVDVELSSNVTVIGNRITGNGVDGIHLASSTDVLVHDNTFLDNGPPQAFDNFGPENAFDNGYPDGGNFWSDYAGTDNCSGPGQDVCPDPDGIGDTPYVIDADTVDRYPLMSPAPGMRARTGPTLGTGGPSMFRQIAEPATAGGGGSTSEPTASRPTPRGPAWPAASDPTRFRRPSGVRAF